MAETTGKTANTAPTEGVRGAFQVAHASPVLAGDAWGDGWRCDHAVLTPVPDPVRGAWTSQVMDRIRPVGVTVPRPLRSTDGRFSVGGWTARTFVSGHRSPRFDEVAAAALSVNAALAGERRPPFLGSGRPTNGAGRDGTLGDVALFSAAEDAAWADDPTELLAPVMDPSAVPRPDVAAAMAKAARLLPLRGEVGAPDQLVHGDMLGCTIFDGYADPVVVDLVPAWRPAVWSVALLAVDAVAWASAEDALIDRWAHLPDLNQLLLRAVVYRLFVHAVLPDSRAEAWPGLERVSDIVAVRITGRSGRDDMMPGESDGIDSTGTTDGAGGTGGTASADTAGTVDGTATHEQATEERRGRQGGHNRG